MLGPVLDVFRMRQYFDVIVGARDLIAGMRDDVGFLDDVRRALVSLPVDAWPEPASPFPLVEPGSSPRRLLEWRCARRAAAARSRRSWASARAFEERGMRPALISLCSGSALFGFPIAAGVSADDPRPSRWACGPRTTSTSTGIASSCSHRHSREVLPGSFAANDSKRPTASCSVT